MYGATVDLDDAPLRALGIHRLEVPVPFFEAGGPANAFLIEDPDGRFTLFDTGVGTTDGIVALRAHASEQGLDLGRLSRIIVSHGHVDHFGNAQQLSEESGARVFVHPLDRPKVLGHERFPDLLRRHRAYFAKLGVPLETLDLMQASSEKGALRVRYVEDHRLGELRDGEVLHFRHFDARVMHCPGHTPGLIGLHAERPRLFFADDHLLVRVSPNPVLDFCQGEGRDKFRALSRYIDSARRVRELELDAVLPGHGPAFHGHRSLIDDLFGFYEKRQAKLLAALRQAPATPFELLAAIWPRRDVPRLVLMLSEVLANLEVLEDRGLARVVEPDADVVRYAPS
ncbi:MAG: MBL fold metallo-hydrolase [Myxococcota bacterium]